MHDFGRRPDHFRVICQILLCFRRGGLLLLLLDLVNLGFVQRFVHLELNFVLNCAFVNSRVGQAG